MVQQKPSTAEDEYFAREDAEKKRKLALSQIKQQAAEELAQLRTQHHNHCPECGQAMQELTLGEVSVRRCFCCNGVFLSEANLRRLTGETGYWEHMVHFFIRHNYGTSHG